MALTGREGEFDDLCQQYSTWIIEYDSEKFKSPLYMVWLTESTDEGNDKFVLSANNKILAAHSPGRLLEVVKDHLALVPDKEKTSAWLIRAFLSDPCPTSAYDIYYLKACISSKKLDKEFSVEMANFINLVGDLGHQLEDDDLLDYTWDNSLRDTWDFFYDNIFWPRWGHEDTFDESKVPKFEPDFEELEYDFNLLLEEFESRIEVK